MSVYGHTLVDNNILKEWVKKLSITDLRFPQTGEAEIDAEIKQILSDQLHTFQESVSALTENDDWRYSLKNVSTMFLRSIFQISDNEIRIANFYECFIIPSDLQTKKRIIKGFDYLSFGGVVVNNNNTMVASIGEKSDLLWEIFYPYFIVEEDGMTTHTMANHEELMSLQIYDVMGEDIESIRHRVQEILLTCSVEHNLNFKIETLDFLLRDKGNDNFYSIQSLENCLEEIPLLYFNNAVGTSDIRLKYLSYYQVIEYFFIRCQHYALIDNIKNTHCLENNPLDHKLVKTVLDQYKKSLKEIESLILVLKRSIDINDLKNWINSQTSYQQIYCHSTNSCYKLDLSKPDDKIISKVAYRIYSFRCAIAHAKGDMEEYVAIPTQSNEILFEEMPLIRYVAIKVINKCSEK